MNLTQTILLLLMGLAICNDGRANTDILVKLQGSDQKTVNITDEKVLRSLKVIADMHDIRVELLGRTTGLEMLTVPIPIDNATSDELERFIDILTKVINKDDLPKTNFTHDEIMNFFYLADYLGVIHPYLGNLLVAFLFNYGDIGSDTFRWERTNNNVKRFYGVEWPENKYILDQVLQKISEPKWHLQTSKNSANIVHFLLNNKESLMKRLLESLSKSWQKFVEKNVDKSNMSKTYVARFIAYAAVNIYTARFAASDSTTKDYKVHLDDADTCTDSSWHVSVDWDSAIHTSFAAVWKLVDDNYGIEAKKHAISLVNWAREHLQDTPQENGKIPSDLEELFVFSWILKHIDENLVEANDEAYKRLDDSFSNEEAQSFKEIINTEIIKEQYRDNPFIDKLTRDLKIL